MKESELIGCRCKSGNAFSQAVLIGRAFWLVVNDYYIFITIEPKSGDCIVIVSRLPEGRHLFPFRIALVLNLNDIKLEVFVRRLY